MMKSAFRSFQDSVWIRLDATTEGLSRLPTETSVAVPRTLVLIGQHIRRPVCLLYCLDDRTSVGRYLPISFPLVGSRSSQTMSLRSGMYGAINPPFQKLKVG